jgi:putative Mg2+ transporter-C (MgtC) family protein
MADGIQSLALSSIDYTLFGRLALSVVLAAAIGLERELHGKEAGLRTTILICLGATLFAELSRSLAGPGSDPTRITSNVVTGIGFLGAGTILRHGGRIQGLTTAATIWVVAAVGMAVGGGQYMAAIGTTALVLIVLIPLRAWEIRTGKRWGGVGNPRR